MGVVFILISGAAFGLLPWFARTAFDHGVEPLGLLTARFTIATIVLLVLRLATQRGKPWPNRILALQLFSLGVFGYAIQSSFYFLGIQRIDVSLATIIFYSYPVTVVLAGWALFGHKPTLRMGVCLVVVVIGTALTAGQVKAGSATGVLFMVGASVTYTVYILFSSRVVHKAGALTSLLFVMFGSACGHLLAYPLHHSQLPSDTTGWAAVIGATVISTIIAMGFFFAGISRLEPGIASVLSTTEPVVSIAVGVFALNESLTPIRVMGALAVLAGVAVLAQLSRAETT